MVARGGGAVKVYVVRNLWQLQAKVYFRVLIARRLRCGPRRRVGDWGYGNVEVGLIFICICAVGSICYRRYLAAEMSLRSKCIVTVHGDIYNSYCFAVNLNFDISPRLIFCRVSCDFKRGNLAVAAVVEEQVIVFRSVYVGVGADLQLPMFRDNTGVIFRFTCVCRTCDINCYLLLIACVVCLAGVVLGLYGISQCQRLSVF